jgi:hypothetical protein
MKQTIYDVDYFIRKFSAIPEENWLINEYARGTSYCAFGHCGMRDNNSIDRIPEAKVLAGILPDAAIINDGEKRGYQQPTPKQRVLAALYDIKKAQYPEISEPPVTVEDLIGEPAHSTHP